MDIVVTEELKAYIDPLTPDEHDALERSLLAEGCRDALVLWGDILVDGHNRYAICQKHGLPFQTVQNTRFQSIEDVHLWMIDQHLGRRSLSDFQRGVLALRKREIVGARRALREQAAAAEHPVVQGAPATDAASPVPAASKEDALDTREGVARAARLRSSQVQMIETIHQNAAPEVVAALKSGTLSLNAAAAVATLPAEEQTAAAAAGKDELKQAAKRVREARRKLPREASDEAAEAPAEGEAEAASPAANADVADLQRQVAKLKAENKKLTQENAVLRKQVLTLLDRSRPSAEEGGAPAAAVDEDPPF